MRSHLPPATVTVLAKMPPILVAIGFFLAVLASLASMAYVAWRGSQPSAFFAETVSDVYELQLDEDGIDAYYDLKDKMHQKYAPEDAQGSGTNDTCEPDVDGDPSPAAPTWVQKAPPDARQELQKALMKRLVGGIDRLDQVQKDKPGNWRLWRSKLVSERFWGSLCEAEKMVTEEIDLCLAEANELEPGWREHIFPQALQCWRALKQKEFQQQAEKKEVQQQKKAKEQEERRKVAEIREAEEDKQRQARLAEKAMEKLLREEALEVSAKTKDKGKKKEAPKSKGKSKK